VALAAYRLVSDLDLSQPQYREDLECILPLLGDRLPWMDWYQVKVKVSNVGLKVPKLPSSLLANSSSRRVSASAKFRLMIFYSHTIGRPSLVHPIDQIEAFMWPSMWK